MNSEWIKAEFLIEGWRCGHAHEVQEDGVTVRCGACDLSGSYGAISAIDVFIDDRLAQ
jgi:hypothetical protein